MLEKSTSFNQLLTTMAQGAALNPSEELDLAALFFPTLKVSARTGEFDKYDRSPALTAVETLLARDGAARRIQLDKRTDFWSCKPNAIEISTFEPDLLQDDAALIREDNLRTLMSSQFTSRNVQAVNLVKSAVTPVSGLGNWSSANADVIADLDALLKSVTMGTGKKANKMVLGRNAWKVLRNNAALIARAGGISYAVTPEHLKEALTYGNLEIIIADNAVLENDQAQELLADDVIVFYNQPSPSRTDMSFAKEFTLMPRGPEVLSYKEKGVTHVDMLMWSSDLKVTNPNAAARLVVS